MSAKSLKYAEIYDKIINIELGEIVMLVKEKKNFEDYFKIVKHKLPYWDELPEIDLYVDQVIILMDKYLSFYKTDEESPVVTHAMINNYVKHGMMPAPVKKKYSREHVAYLIIICSLKQALPISDIKDLIERRVKKTSIEETLNYFSELYDNVFNTLIAIAKKFSSKTSNEDTIFGDAALFLAMGSSGSKYMAKQIVDISKKEEKAK